MLCDDLLREIKGASGLVPGVPEDKAAFMTAQGMHWIESAQRFVLAPHVVQTIDALAQPRQVEAMRDHLFMPAEVTWIEWREGSIGSPKSRRHGLLLEGTDDGKRRSIWAGSGFYVCDEPRAGGSNVLTRSFAYSLPSGALFQFNPRDARFMAGQNMAHLMSLRGEEFGAWLGAAIALMNTPRLSHMRFEDHAKLNRARERSGKPALLSWSEVSIKIDAGTLGHGDQRTQTSERALHHVRSFMRLKHGRVEIVRPHWRGNPEVGVKRHRYTVSRAEDEAGEWKGGPLPCPQIIKELS